MRFDGRASRSEFWFWALWYVIGGAAAGILGSVFGFASDDASSQVARLWSLACAVGFVALTVRRLHDVNLSGYFAFLFVIPPIGVLFSIIIGCQASNPQGQRFDRPDRG